MSLKNWVIKQLMEEGAEEAVNQLLNNNVVGIGALIHTEELGGYRDSSHIGDWHYNTSDRQWYDSPPAPDYGKYDWTGLATMAQQFNLNALKKDIDRLNEVEKLSPIPEVGFWDIVNVGIDATQKKFAHDRYWDARDYRLTRIDPLIFDLNNDGITTTDARTTPVLFDHDGDGIKNGTGWVSKEDGFLVVDRNKPKKLLPKFAYLNKVV
jgi:hypothetical protein